MSATVAAPASKLKVFVSYSRRDLAFADQLVAVLELHGLEPSIDRKGIHGAENWELRLGQLILEADIIVFVLSPDSAASEVCAWEVEEALRRGKRIVPVLCRPLESAKPHPRLRDLNYIFLYADEAVPGSGFGTGQRRLIEALSVDVDWLREHTRLEELADHWNGAGRTTDRLVRGSELSGFRDWRDRRPANAPELTGLQRAYLAASEAEEEARASTERRRLEEMAAAQAQRQKAIEEREAALRREAEAQRARARARRIIAWGAGAVALALIGGALGFAAQERRASAVEVTLRARAEEQAALAEKAKAKSEELVALLVRNLDIGWAEDARNPDYRHLTTMPLARELAGKPFTLEPATIELLLKANAFEPVALHSRIILALRGATVAAMQRDSASITLTDARPDHEGLRCAFVVLDRGTGRLSAFAGSTVPGEQFMRRYFNDYIQGSRDSIRANLMPTGMWPYRVGAHSGGRVWPALRLSSGKEPDLDGAAQVRRTLNDLVYDLDDNWDEALANNVHLTNSLDRFSSAGSLTIRGVKRGEGFTGDYAAFWESLGDYAKGEPVSVVLLTGLEAAIAAQGGMGPPGGPPDPVALRLRQGSGGPLVLRLQQALGIAATGRFEAETTLALARLQQQKLGWSDGIHSPEMDGLLGLSVFAQ